MWEECGTKISKEKEIWSVRQAGSVLSKKKKTPRKTSADDENKKTSMTCAYTWDADNSWGIEGLVVGCKCGKLCVGCIDRQVGAGTFHIVPTFFHNSAVSTIWWPAGGQERKVMFWPLWLLILCHLYLSMVLCNTSEHSVLNVLL